MTYLDSKFKEFNIDNSKVGFYDTPEFLEVERQDPNFLEIYAEYVSLKKYSNEYTQKAKIEIPIIAEILNDELIKDGRLGACIDVSIVLSRILEKEGYWNYFTKGSLTIIFPGDSKIRTKYLWSVDVGEYQAGHSWVVAPPYTVIDLAIKQQVFKDGETNYIPKFICTTNDKTTVIKEMDVISPVASRIMEFEGITENKLEHCKDNFEEFTTTFPPVETIENNVIFKYITMGISVADKPLERVASLKLSGRLGIELYNDIIIPKLRELRKTV